MDTLYRINRVLMFAAMLLYVPLTLALVAGLGFAVYWLVCGVGCLLPSAGMHRRVSGGMFVLVFLASVSLLGVAAALLAGLCALFKRLHNKPVYGVLISPTQQRVFFELVARVCKKLRVKPPAQCYLSPFSEMSIGQRPLMQADGKVGRNVRTLVVGAGLLVHIRIDELTTILAHEMAHAKVGDTRMCRWAWRFHNALVGAIVAQAEEQADALCAGITSGVVKCGLIVYYRVFVLLYAIDSRWRELRADRMAAKLCGPQNVRNALIKTHLAGYVSELSVESLLFEYCESGKPIEDLYNEHQRRWEQLPAERLEAAENAMFLERHSLYDSHPCLTTRMRGMKGIEAKEIKGDKPATRLFADWGVLASLMTQALMRRGRYLHGAYMARLLGGR